MKKFKLLILISTLAIGLSSCEQVYDVLQPDPGDQSGDISIGVVLPMTGRLASASPLIEQGFNLALHEINMTRPDHSKVKFIVEDDGSTPEGAAAAFNKLIHEDGVSVILGPASSSATEAAFPVAQENQVAAISPTSSARGLGAIGDYVFRIPLTTDVLISIGVKTTQAKLGYQNAATLYDETDLFSTDRDAALQEVFAANGIETLVTETFRGGDTDFSEQLTRIKALNPDVLFVSMLPPDKPKVLIQAREAGISVPIFMSSMVNDEVQEAGAAAEGAITFIGWLPTDETPGNQAFVQNYSAAFGVKPNGIAASSYAALYVLEEAIENAASTDAASIRDALANIKNFDTVLGKFSFNADGDAVYPPKVLIVKDGALQPFE